MTLVWSPGYAPVDEYYDNVSLLLYGNGTNGSTTITDNSPTPKTVTAFGNAQISTAQSKFGGASIAFDGAGDYLTVPSGTAFQFGTGDFTVETWARLSTTGAQHNTIITTGEAEISTGFSFQRLNTGELNFRSGGSAYSYNSSISVPIDAWTHLAASRGGGIVRLFIGGVVVFSGVLPVNFSDAATLIGYRNASYNGYLNGYIDDLRITKGVARYTSNFIPPTASFPDLSPTGRLTVAYTIDSDAAAYIAAVEAADGQALETATRTAIDSFVKGCKNDGIWNAIKASCILAGARTLAGALVPLVGTAPTNVNFVSGDYNRKTGLVGNVLDKYLNSNRNNNADPQNNHHLSCFLGSTAPDTGSFIGSRTATGYKIILPASPATSNGVLGRRMGANSTLIDLGIAGNPTGFHGLSRSVSGTYTRRVATANASISGTSETTNSSPIYVFALPNGFNDTTPGTFTATRLAFYSIGESLDLALLDTRVTSLINAFAAVIP